MSHEATLEYLHHAGEQLVVDALDELELVFSDPQYGPTDCNHLFINVAPTVLLERPEEYASRVHELIMRYRTRFAKVRLMEAEIRLMVRPSQGAAPYPLRFMVSNESGYFLNIHMYREVVDPEQGSVFQALDPANGGALHGQSAQAPYEVKDRVQVKRYAAQQNNTTYIYDYIDLIKEVVGRRWNFARSLVPADGGKKKKEKRTKEEGRGKKESKKKEE